MNTKYVKVSEAAERLGVNVQTIRLWSDRGTIKTWRTPGNHRLIPVSEIERLTDSSEV